MQWFRLYNDVVNDPKVQRLPAETFRGWINILCIASKNDGVLPCIEDIAFTLRMDESAATELISALQTAGLIEQTEAGAAPHKWRDRQFKSDTSTDRVKRHRAKRHETERNVTCNVSETASETDQSQSRADTDTESPPKPPSRGGKTKRGSRLDLDALPSEWASWARDEGFGNPEREFDRFRDYWKAAPGQKGVKADWLATWRNWIRRALDDGKGEATADSPVTPRPECVMVWSGECDWPQLARRMERHGYRIEVPDGPGELRGPLPPPHLVPQIRKVAEGFGVELEVRES